MDTMSAVTILKELGTPAIAIIGFAWMIFMLNTVKKDMAKLETKVSSDMAKLEMKVSSDMAKLEMKVSSDMAKLETKVSSDIAGIKTDMAKLDAKVSALAVDMKSIKGNHLPHIEAAIKELAKGTPNEEHVKAILDLSREVELRTSDSEQVVTSIREE